MNTTRLLATILAVPNAALIAAGLFQSALDASLNHALSGCSASAYSAFSQNSRSVLREMILIIRARLCHDPMGTKAFFNPLAVINAYEVAHPPGVTAGIDSVFQKFGRALKTHVRPVLVSLGTSALPGFHS